MRRIVRRPFRRVIHPESLECRRMLAGDVNSVVQVSTNDFTEQQVVRNFLSQKFFQLTSLTGTLIEPTSQADFHARLKELVGKYWDGLLGKSLQEAAPLVIYEPWFAAALDSGSTFAHSVVRSEASNLSITNTRHAGIDEGDMSDLTDDGFLYTIIGNVLQIVDMRDKDALDASASVGLAEYGAQLMVSGDWLIVLHNASDGTRIDSVAPLDGLSDSAMSPKPLTKVKLYDISQRTEPRLVSTTVVDGYIQAARLVGDQLTLVVQNNVVLPSPTLVRSTDGENRFQSLDSYFATHRDGILAALQPDYRQSKIDGVFADMIDIGAWDDLAFANEQLNQSVSVLKLALVDGNFSILDSETIAGAGIVNVYQAEEDIYLYTNQFSNWPNSETLIYKIDVTGAGELDSVGVAKVVGQVSSSTWLNEYEGVLQVASLGRSITEEVDRDLLWQPVFRLPTVIESANVTTIGETGDGWHVLGTLRDIAPGQSLLAANFIDDKAVLTTGLMQSVRPFDPLHGIDLSDPTHPVERSELTIPGFTTFLQPVDDMHWLGLGFDQDPNNASNVHLQVSLYRMEDLANPFVVDRWVSDEIVWSGTWDPHDVHFDQATGLLTMLANQAWTDGTYLAPLLRIDLDSDDPLQLLGYAQLSEMLMRGFTLDDVYVAVTQHSVTTYDVNDMSAPLSRAYVGNYDSLNWQYWAVGAGQSQTWRLAEFWRGEPFEITSIETTGLISATLNADQSITLSAPATAGGATQQLQATVRFASGHTRVVTISLYVYFSVEEPRYADGNGSVQGRFTDDDGNEVTELSAGDEVWVTVSASDSRDVPLGIFAAYVDITFDSGNVTVIGQPEPLGDYTNGIHGDISANGIQRLGGFGDSTPPLTAVSDIARFKIRIENDLPVSISIVPNREPMYEFLVHGLPRALDPNRIASSILTSGSTNTTTARVDSAQDVNADGAITALDVLQVVNFINSQGSPGGESHIAQTAHLLGSSQYDVTGDGVVSGLDVLQIINTINARS